tara:strand:+ start:375 stop:536 length:162 start_codon:yes stop_codon:yes gene_type:complete
MSDIDSIAGRIKKRVKDDNRIGRVGGTAHKKLVAQRRNEVELRKKRKNAKIEC